MLHPCHYSLRALLAYQPLRFPQQYVFAGYMPIASCIETTESTNSGHGLASPLRTFKLQSYFTRSH